jgi:hypothetical protein
MMRDGAMTRIGRHRLRLVSLLMLVVALLGPAAHVLEMPGKWRLTPEQWLATQQNLYPAFAVAGALGYLGAPLACALLARAVRGTSEARAAWIAAGLVMAALIVWATVVAPVNGRIAAATPGTLDGEWMSWRARWDAGHAIGALLVAVALVLLLRASLARGVTPAPGPPAG